MRLMDANKYCESLNTYPLEKIQSNFMAFYRDALQYTFECEVKAIPIVWIDAYCTDCSIGLRDNDEKAIKKLLEDWKEENGKTN